MGGGSANNNSNDDLLLFNAEDAEKYLRSIGIAHSIPCVWKNWNVIFDRLQLILLRLRRSSSSLSTSSTTRTTPTTATTPTRTTTKDFEKISQDDPVIFPERYELTKIQMFLKVLQHFDTWVQLLTLVLSGIFNIGSTHFVRVSVITSICKQVCESIYQRKHLVVLAKEQLLKEKRRREQLQKTVWGRIQLKIKIWIENLRDFFKWMLLLPTNATAETTTNVNHNGREEKKQVIRKDTTSSSSSTFASSSSSSSSIKTNDSRHRHHVQHAKRLLTGHRDSVLDDILVGVVQIVTVCVLAAIEDNNNGRNLQNNTDTMSWLSWIVQNLLWIVLTSKWKTIGLSWMVFLLTLLENDVLFNNDLSTSQKLRKVSWIAFVGFTSGKYVFSFGR